MIQGGDPTGTGSGGSGTNGADGAVQDDEFNVDVRYTSSGLLALANRGDDTNDCQFFITAVPYRDGDYQYTIIGKLVAGDDIRQAIASVPVEANGWNEVSKPINAPMSVPRNRSRATRSSEWARTKYSMMFGTSHAIRRPISTLLATR